MGESPLKIKFSYVRLESNIQKLDSLKIFVGKVLRNGQLEGEKCKAIKYHNSRGDL